MKVGDRITLVDMKQVPKAYRDHLGKEHPAHVVFEERNICITKWDEEEYGPGPYPFKKFYGQAIDEYGNIFKLYHDNWGDGITAEFHWTEVGDEKRKWWRRHPGYGDTYILAPVIPFSESILTERP